MVDPLDNIAWHSLIGPHARFAVGAGAARRYAPGFSPLAAFAEPQRPDFDALAAHCVPGEQLYCVDWTGAVPAGWQVDVETALLCMVWAATEPPKDDAPDARPLDARHAAQALQLTGITRPGPFGPRTLELGDYFGIFEGEQLVAMAGERLHAGSLREVSGVCTLPAFQGRGLARRLMGKLMARQVARDETPFLHVLASNTGAQALYRQLGFRDERLRVLRVVSRSRM
ncbi:MAG TPA: GNAT family N-acetyltransferase [Burkholderiaceae bacterium]|nr:GNAT family N-acetyltransferase [Burkholderiaceae bacterium]